MATPTDHTDPPCRRRTGLWVQNVSVEAYDPAGLNVLYNFATSIATISGNGGTFEKRSSVWLFSKLRSWSNVASALGWAVAGTTRLASRMANCSVEKSASVDLSATAAARLAPAEAPHKPMRLVSMLYVFAFWQTWKYDVSMFPFGSVCNIPISAPGHNHSSLLEKGIQVRACSPHRRRRHSVRMKTVPQRLPMDELMTTQAGQVKYLRRLSESRESSLLRETSTIRASVRMQ